MITFFSFFLQFVLLTTVTDIALFFPNQHKSVRFATNPENKKEASFNPYQAISMSSRNPSYTNPKPCKHLSDYKRKHGLHGYNLIQNHIKTSPHGRTTIDTSKSICSSCSGSQGRRLYICLICSSVSCFLSPDPNPCALHHARSHVGHEISIDIERAELYCFMCCDQVYDPDFDKAVMGKHVMGLGRNEGGVVGYVLRSSKRKRLGFGGLVGLDSERAKRLVSIRDRGSKSCFPLGLRGLNNLGSTCFMNSVLQALLHAPPLRNYFLSDSHNHETCRRRSPDRLCLPCDIDVIFSAVFSGERTPYSPAQFLYRFACPFCRLVLFCMSTYWLILICNVDLDVVDPCKMQVYAVLYALFSSKIHTCSCVILLKVDKALLSCHRMQNILDSLV